MSKELIAEYHQCLQQAVDGRTRARERAKKYAAAIISLREKVVKLEDKLARIKATLEE
jgi:uncharacterized coiled-coil DUF342 family protein